MTDGIDGLHICCFFLESNVHDDTHNLSAFCFGVSEETGIGDGLFFIGTMEAYDNLAENSKQAANGCLIVGDSYQAYRSTSKCTEAFITMLEGTSSGRKGLARIVLNF